jgi:GcrA cell cycle regulator
MKPANPWTIPGITQRLAELHALSGDDYLTTAQIAERLSFEFETVITRNGVIGRTYRMDMPLRSTSPQRSRKKARSRMYQRVDAPIAPPLAPRNPDGITIYQLGPGDCRWPLGKMGDRPPFNYCGKAVEESEVYCTKHCNLAYHPARKQFA